VIEVPPAFLTGKARRRGHPLGGIVYRAGSLGDRTSTNGADPTLASTPRQALPLY
jgi:hypothetical protein